MMTNGSIPTLARVAFGDYALAWIRERPNLRPTTEQVYRYLLGRHLQPFFGNRPLADIKEAHIRRWRRELLDSGASPASVTKTYRLIKAIMNTAVSDGIIRSNPCQVRGAGEDHHRSGPC
jgi:integrase-like protein